jgi:hypothetical protein
MGRAHRYRFLLAHNAQRPPLPRESGPQTRGAGPSRERGRQRPWASQKLVPMGPPRAASTGPGNGSDGENGDEKRAGSGENPTGCAAKRAQRKGSSPSTLYARAREAAQFELGDFELGDFFGSSWARVSVHRPVGFRAPRGKAWEPAGGSVDACAHRTAQFEVSDFLLVFSAHVSLRTRWGCPHSPLASHRCFPLQCRSPARLGPHGASP